MSRRSRSCIAAATLVALTSAAACSGSTSGEAVSNAGVNTSSSTASTTSAGQSETNEQGRIEKAFGEAAGLSDNATGEPAISFTLTNPRMSDTCSGFWKFEPTNGVYLVADIAVTTMATYSTATTGQRNSNVASLFDWSLGPGRWGATNQDGTVNADLLSTASLNCDEMNTDAFSGQLAPASNYVGSYAFDVAPETESIFLQLPRSSYGWEWDLPDGLLGPDTGSGGF